MTQVSGTQTLAEFLLERISEDEARGAADDATAPRFAWAGPG